MEKKAFEVIINQIWNTISSKGFNKEINNKNYNAIFSDDKIAYKIYFEKDKKRFQLLSSSVENGQYEDKWQLVSSWGFDVIVDDEKQAKSIAMDFLETIEGPSNHKKQIKKKKHKDEDGNIDPLFLANRIANILPELKDSVQYEKRAYPEFRGATFAKEKIVPAINNFLSFYSNDEASLKRLSKVLNDCYDSGDFDVRSIITIIILNSIEKDTVKDLIKSRLSEELQKSWKAAEHLKGKTIKPEKVKKMRFKMPS